jgi:hypothetical protein
MNKKIIATAIAAAFISSATIAEFKVKVFLEENTMKFEIPNTIKGDSVLSPSTINRGETSMLTWSYDYVSNLDVTGDTEYSSTNNAGSITLSPLKTSNYTVNVDNGKVKTSKSLKLTVIQPTPLITFNSDKVKIGEGQSVKLSWDVSNAEDAVLNNNIGSVSLNSSIDVTPVDDTTYTLKAIGYNKENEVNKSIAIDVVKNSNINSFTVNKNKFTVGESAMFNWSVNDSENLVLSPYGTVNKTATSQVIPLNSLGDFDYTLTTTSFNNSQKSSTLKVSVYGEPTISSYTVNDLRSVNVEAGDNLVFKWNQSNADTIKLDNTVVTGITTTLTAPTTTKNYVLAIQNPAGKTVQDTVTVNVVAPVAINTFTTPTAVFANAPFVMNWTGSSVEKYELSGTTGSGISSTENIGKSVTKTVIPTTVGTHSYTLKATNLANKYTEQTKNVVVEADPTFTGFTVNGQTTINVAPSAPLNFLAVGQSTGSVLQGRNATNTSDFTLPTTASTTAGSTVYTGVVQKTLNSVKRASAVRTVTVNVINAPTISAITGPTNVFANSPITISWSGSNVSSYKIKSNNANSGIATTDVDLGTATSRAITPTVAGTYTYTVTATNAAGVSTSSSTTIVVEADPIFTGFTVNGSANANLAPSTALTFAGSGFSSGATLVGRDSAGTNNNTLPTTASSSVGSTTYYAAATKTLNGVARYSAVRSVIVNVVAPPTISSVTAPSNVFANTAFSMTWAASGATNYKIKSNNAASGIATTDVDLSTATSRSITPTAAGTYIYTITATNSIGVTTTSTKSVIVEADPTFTGFTVNGTTSVSVSPSAPLTYAISGNSSGSTLVARNSANTSNVTNPTTAPAAAGTSTYYAAVTKTLNSVTRYSAVKSVDVTVVAGPAISAVTAPTNVFISSAFTMSWTASGATNYKIKSNNAASGIATTDVDLGTAMSRAITPTAAGTYIYTITATNSIGVTTTSTKSVVVEADPTFTGFTVNGSSSINIAPSSTLSFVGSGYSSGATLVGRNSGNTANETLPTNASSAAGTSTYYAAANKTLNGVTRYSAVKSVAVTVVAGPAISAVTAPTNVFTNAAFTMSWTATGATNYKIKSNNAASGIATTDVDLSTATSRSITPTAAGTYTYTITATNSIGVTTISTKSVVVEADPSFTGFTVNGTTSVSVSPSATLTYAISGNSSGSTLVARNSANTANATNPTTAPAAVGTTTYYGAVTKTLNSVTRYSAVKSVTVTVVAGPAISAVTAPTNVFANAAFTISWTATGATNYKIKANNATSGIATTDVALGTATSRAITPTAAGTFTYTITATNSLGKTITSTKSVIVEADPTFTGFTVNGAASASVAPSAAIAFAGSGYSSNATLVGRNSANTANATLPTTASASAGTYTYYAAATKTLNGVVRYSGLRSVVVTVTSPCRNDSKNIWQVVVPPQTGGTAFYSVYWDGVQRYSVQTSSITITSVKGSDGATYYRNATGVGSFDVCRQ